MTTKTQDKNHSPQLVGDKFKGVEDSRKGIGIDFDGNLRSSMSSCAITINKRRTRK